MTGITYGLVEERYRLGERMRVSYGIVGYANAESIGTTSIVVSVHDITSDKAKLSDLVQKCNELELSVVHLNDVVEDYLAG